MADKPFKNIVSPDIVSYRRSIIIAEYSDLDEAKRNLDRDVLEWQRSHRNTAWYKINYPFAFATIGIDHSF